MACAWELPGSRNILFISVDWATYSEQLLEQVNLWGLQAKDHTIEHQDWILGALPSNSQTPSRHTCGGCSDPAPQSAGLASLAGPLARVFLTLPRWIGAWPLAVPGAGAEGGWAMCSPTLALVLYQCVFCFIR